MEQPLSTTINMDLSSTKTAFPLIPTDMYAKWRVSKVVTEQKKVDFPITGVVHADGTGSVLQIGFELVEPVVDTEGKPLLPGALGSKFSEQINMYSRTDEKAPKDLGWFVKKICGIVDALLGTGDADNTKNKPPRPAMQLSDPQFAAQLGELIMGQVLVAKMAIDTYEGVTRNKMKSLHFPGDLTA